MEVGDCSPLQFFAFRLINIDLSTQMRTGFKSNCFMASILNTSHYDLDYQLVLLHQLHRGLTFLAV